MNKDDVVKLIDGIPYYRYEYTDFLYQKLEDYKSRCEKAIPMLKELNIKLKDILKIGIDIKEISDIENILNILNYEVEVCSTGLTVKEAEENLYKFSEALYKEANKKREKKIPEKIKLYAPYPECEDTRFEDVEDKINEIIDFLKSKGDEKI